jgi:hypothetical protein
LSYARSGNVTKTRLLTNFSVLIVTFYATPP